LVFAIDLFSGIDRRPPKRENHSFTDESILPRRATLRAARVPAVSRTFCEPRPNQTEALRLLEELLNRSKREMIDFTSVAAVYTILGDIEQALISLEKAWMPAAFPVYWQESTQDLTRFFPSHDINRS
jgi:hypothetical protein